MGECTFYVVEQPQRKKIHQEDSRSPLEDLQELRMDLNRRMIGPM